MASLEELRAGIDGIDAELVALLNKRADLVLAVKEAKAKGNIEIYSPSRERQILDRVAELARGGAFPKASLEKIFANVISATRSLIGEMNIAFYGAECSLGYAAALKQFGSAVRYSAQTSIEETFVKVESGEAHYGLVPLETSAGGLNIPTFDQFMNSQLQIIAEVSLEERFAVLGTGKSVLELKRIYSDAWSFAQTSLWLRENLSAAERVLVESPAIAAERASKDPGSAAVALEMTAELFGLKVLASGVSNNLLSSARFAVIGHNTPVPSGRDKTSILCSIEERAGALRDLLRPFSERGITLLKIESKPLRHQAWEYVFFFDCLGHIADEQMQLAVAELQKFCPYVKVLGSYPRQSA